MGSRNTKLLKDIVKWLEKNNIMRKRWDLIIKIMRKRPHAIGAEIGVWRGTNAQRILANLQGIEKYYCVDPWQLYSEHAKTLRVQSKERVYPHQRAYGDFLQRVKPWKNKVIIVRKMSMDALSLIPDEYLDWVFIDANHAYEYAKQDIIGWSAKVKQGGIIFGHDFYDKQKVIREVPFGVQRAVKELISNYHVDAQCNVWYTTKGA